MKDHLGTTAMVRVALLNFLSLQEATLLKVVLLLANLQRYQIAYAHQRIYSIRAFFFFFNHY